MSDQLDWHLLDRYFSGEASPQETAAVDRWLRGASEHAEELKATQKIWEEASVVRPRFDIRAAKVNMHRKMAEPMRVSSPAHPLRFAILRGKSRVWATAAGIAALLVGVLVWQVAQSPSAASAVVAAREYVTSPGERSVFHLPDGTKVMLGPASRLAVAATYGAAAREVHLEGEGYFDVVHDGRRPFAVHAGGAVARDLGTKFVLRAYAADSSVRVVVAEGKVALETRVLSPGQMGVRAADGVVAVQEDVDVDRYLAWTNGNLVFDNTPLSEAIPELNRWYNLQFQLADSGLAPLLLTGTLKDQLSAETLDLLAISLGVRIERRGRTVLIGVKRS